MYCLQILFPYHNSTKYCLGTSLKLLQKYGFWLTFHHINMLYLFIFNFIPIASLLKSIDFQIHPTMFWPDV